MSQTPESDQPASHATPLIADPDEAPFAAPPESGAPDERTPSPAAESAPATADGTAEHDDPNAVFYFLGAFAVVVLGFILRAALAAHTGLSDEEALVYAASRHLNPGYFEQAPLPAYLAALARLLFGDTPFALRFFGLLASSATALTLYLVCTSFYQSRRAGFYAATLFSCAPVVFLQGASAIGEPVLGFFWLVSALAVLYAARQDTPLPLLPVGLLVGLGFLSQWTMLLFWPLALLYLLFNNHRMLRSGWLLWGLILSVLLLSPLLFWHAEHRFAAFATLFSGLSGDAAQASRLTELLQTQLLGLSPFLLFGLLGAGFWCFVHPSKDEERLLFWFSLPFLAFLIAHAMITQTPCGAPDFWVGTLPLFPPLASLVAKRSSRAASPWLSAVLLGPFALWWRPSTRRLLFGWLLVPALLLDGLLILHLESDVLANALPETRAPQKADFTEALFGFGELRKILNDEQQSGRKTDFVAATQPALCAQLTFILRDTPLNVYCLDPARDLFDDFPATQAPSGKSGLIVSDSLNEQDPNERLECEGHLTLWRELPVFRGEHEARRFKLWVCTHYIGPRRAGSPIKATPVKAEPAAAQTAPVAPTPTPGAPSPEVPKGLEL